MKVSCIAMCSRDAHIIKVQVRFGNAILHMGATCWESAAVSGPLKGCWSLWEQHEEDLGSMVAWEHLL